MRRLLTVLATAVATIATVVVVAPPASAHGYISDPPSRQANCASGKVRNCGQIIWEPQSVEGRQGQRNCHAGDARWAPLSDDSRAWPAANVGSTVNFRWSVPVPHSTSTWEYFIGSDRVAVFNDRGRLPARTVNHTVNLGNHSGRIKLLAIWNVADTGMAFYSCVDLQVGPGGPEPTPTPTVTPTSEPTPTPTPTVTPTQGPATNWVSGTSYNAGDQAIYNGATYRCLQAHTALSGWEPPNVPSLWQRV
ncbi:cellulose-binding protein [Spongiactinospora rosea]|uniref:Cellulose-binding protein n=1 Tax=Spongiactinospora rosea TaxID=2248750 RepID=A0A366LJS4_9ACTN|nr:lytic polysaccharide monooxygenase [Spongiactinospora rosea]RBQ14135.1 cellulose-binding protein [Spongiactinospora rosea]